MTWLVILLLGFSATGNASAPTRILIIGDSITEGYGVSRDSAYPYQLQLLLRQKHPNVEVINAGSSGSTTASALSRLRWHLKRKPDILILALGGNDGLRGFKVSASKENLQKAIDLALKNKITTYLAGMQMPMNYGKKYRTDFAEMYKSLVRENKIKEIPFLLEGVGAQPQFNLADGIHPNEKGHKIIAENLSKLLAKEL